MNWIEEANKNQEKYHDVLSFEDFMSEIVKNPKRHLRTNCHYLKDMFDFFGRSENKFNLFKKAYPDSPEICGQYKTQHEIYKNLCNFIEEGYNNKFLLLVGPNGSSKSSIINKIMKGMEEYSNHDEGMLLTFSWIFPIDSYVKGSLGLGPSNQEMQLKTYSKLDDKEISAIIGSDLKDHPLLLLPKSTRKKFIDEHLADSPDLHESIKKSYLYLGDLSKRNKLIFDSLVKTNKGNYLDVYKHIRVERFFISKAFSVGATTIEPQMHVDANMQQITMDRRIASLPPSLQSLNLFSMNGEVVLSNRGILEFSDLLKRPLDTYKYLLHTMESKTINLQGILTELDILFLGSSNEIHLSAFRQHPDFNSFKGRFNFIKVPYLLNYHEEEKIYEEQINNLKNHSTFEPNSMKALCMWSVMTRLRACSHKNYLQKKLGEIAVSLNPLEKLQLLTDQIIPDRLKSNESQILKRGLDTILNEYNNDKLYEGKFGISPREVKQIIYDLSSEHKIITFLEIFDYLSTLIHKKDEFDFLNISAQGNYNNPNKFIELLKSYSLKRFDNELRESLGLIDHRSYEEYISKYILHVSSLLKGEKIRNTVTGKMEDSDQFFIKEFENNITLNEKAETFRSHLITKLGAYSLDNPGKEIIYTEVFPDLVKKLKESFREEQKNVIDTISKNLVYYDTSKKESKVKKELTKDSKKIIDDCISNLTSKFSYTKEGTLRLIKFLIKEKY
jgi:serine protein kinase